MERRRKKGLNNIIYIEEYDDINDQTEDGRHFGGKVSLKILLEEWAQGDERVCEFLHSAEPHPLLMAKLAKISSYSSFKTLYVYDYYTSRGSIYLYGRPDDDK